MNLDLAVSKVCGFGFIWIRSDSDIVVSVQSYIQCKVGTEIYFQGLLFNSFSSGWSGSSRETLLHRMDHVGLYMKIDTTSKLFLHFVPLMSVAFAAYLFAFVIVFIANCLHTFIL